MTERQCGECTLCCKLLPMARRSKAVREEQAEALVALLERGLVDPASLQGMLADFDKPAGVPCPHQRHRKGCVVYARRPFGCRFWNCRWLAANDTADLRRPDRARYVIDIMPDFITARDDERGLAPVNIEVVQIWCDPAHRDAWRDPALLAYLERRGAEGKAALIRFNSAEAITVFPPALSGDGKWHEMPGTAERERTSDERWAGIAAAHEHLAATGEADARKEGEQSS